MRIAFVVLHYITLNDTTECVESILNNIDYENLDIIVIDNGSPNNSGIELEKLYSTNTKVHIIKNNENLGFAKGNNVGFKYGKYELKADFIVMINNDTVIKQKDFCKKILKKYHELEFAVLGPDIISLADNKHQNPIPIMFNNKKDVEKRIKKYKALNCLSYLYLDNLASTIYSTINSKFRKECSRPTKDIQLHGSCLIFSPTYVNKFDGLYEKTFMYMEESILKYICEVNELKMGYSSEIIVYHKEDSSTNAAMKKEINKRRFYYKNSIKSALELVKLMSK